MLKIVQQSSSVFDTQVSSVAAHLCVPGASPRSLAGRAEIDPPLAATAAATEGIEVPEIENNPPG